MAVEFICESLCRVYLGWNFICSDYGRKFFAQLKFKQLKFKQLKFHSYRQEAKAAKSLSLGLLGLWILLLYERRKVGNEVFDYFGACICGVRAREQYAKMGERDYCGCADPAG